MENLRIYNGENGELIDKVRALVYAEAEKSPEEMDDFFVSECVDFLMELEGRKVLTEERIRKNVACILSRLNKKHVSLKRLLIAACVAIIMFFAFVTTSVAMGNDFEEFVIVKYIREIIDDMFIGDSRYFEGIEVVKENKPMEYETVGQFFADEGLSGILYPEKFPNDAKLARVSYRLDHSNGKDIDYIADFGDSFVTVYLNSKLPAGIFESGKTSKNIAGFECYFSLDGEFAQCDFEYNGNMYCVTSSSYENIVFIIENLKESKRE